METHGLPFLLCEWKKGDAAKMLWQLQTRVNQWWITWTLIQKIYVGIWAIIQQFVLTKEHCKTKGLDRQNQLRDHSLFVESKVNDFRQNFI